MFFHKWDIKLLQLFLSNNIILIYIIFLI